MVKLPLTEPEIGRFAERLGRMILRLPVISGTVGHQWIKDTAKDYFRPDAIESVEAEFLQDVLSRPVPEVLEKWYPRLDGPNGVLFTWPDVNIAGGPLSGKDPK